MPLDVTEYSTLASDAVGRAIMAGQEPSLRNQSLAVSGVSVQSQPFLDTARLVRLHSDVACRVAVGSNPTAASTSMRIAAGATEYLGVAPGLRIAVISTT